MLKIFRNKKTARKIWIVLCIIILPAFIFWGFSGAFRSKGERAYAGKVFGKTISTLDYQDALEATKNQAVMQFGDKFDEMKPMLNLESQAWERIALIMEANNHKIKVSDQEVVKQIENYPFFQRQGKFDEKIYTEMLRYVFRTQPRDFEEQTRQNLLLAKLYKEITKDIKLNNNEIKEDYRKANEEISVFYLAGLPADFSKNITPTDDQIKEYYTKNSIQFKQPISYNVEYLTLDTEAKSIAAAKRLQKKEDPQKIAKDLGTIVKETGSFSQLGTIPGIGWSPQIFAMLSKAKVQDVLTPVQMDKNYFVLKVKEIKDANIPELDKIKDQVKDALIKNTANELAKSKIEECLKLIKENKETDFNRLAKTYILKSDSTSAFKFGSYIEGIGSSDDFWMAADKLKDNQISGVISVPSGFYIIKPKTHTAIDEKKFITEEKEFSEKLLMQKQQEAFIKFTQDLKRKAGII
ncbi:MAG: SurA N-terminal domain-containing protein [Candidatus Omnitrophota bacterium]